MKKLLTILLSLVSINLWGAEYSLSVDNKPVEVTAYKHYHYAWLDMNKSVDIALTVDGEIRNVDVSPHNRNIKWEQKGNKIEFTLDRAGYIMVRINDTDKFFIFADKSQELPIKNVVSISDYNVDSSGAKLSTQQIQKAINESAKAKKTLVFPAGIYTSGQLSLPSNSHIHLCRGAILRTDDSNCEWYGSNDNFKTRRFIYIKDAQNVKITGRGAINGNGAKLRSQFADNARFRLVLAVNSKDILLEGVMLQDPGSWNTQIIFCNNVVVRNIKLMNDIDLSNTDGFDPDATKNMVIEDCFAYCSDDNVAIKTTGYSGYLGDVDNIVVRGNVFLTKKSSLKVGTETKGEKMSNITFENNDVIESDRGMALYVSDGAIFENIKYINNRFERNHPDAKQAGIHFVANRRNEKSLLGTMKGILVKDCTFECHFPKKSEVKYADKGEGIDVVIDNLVIAGQKVVDAEQANISVVNSKVVFK